MFKTIQPVISAEELKRELAVPSELAAKRKRAVDTVVDIITGKDKRKLFVVGPCSADDEDAVCDYASRIARVADDIKDVIYIIIRAYTSKPRTRGDGYLGLLHAQKSLNGQVDISDGLRAMRRLHMRCAAASGLFTADEMLYPDTTEYIDDIVSYIALGARSADDQQHRFVASGIDVAVGVKNSLNGDFFDLAGSVHAVSISNEFLYNGNQVKSNGNRAAHAVLRGAVDIYGNHIRNCCVGDIQRLYDVLDEQGIEKSVVIDAGHSNSGKNPFNQPNIILSTLKGIKNTPALNSFVKGFMLESYIEDGNQPLGGGVYGKSVTDGCLGLEKTEMLLRAAADNIVL